MDWLRFNPWRGKLDRFNPWWGKLSRFNPLRGKLGRRRGRRRSNRNRGWCFHNSWFREAWWNVRESLELLHRWQSDRRPHNRRFENDIQCIANPHRRFKGGCGNQWFRERLTLKWRGLWGRFWCGCGGWLGNRNWSWL